jgi:hypothetical protein
VTATGRAWKKNLDGITNVGAIVKHLILCAIIEETISMVRHHGRILRCSGIIISPAWCQKKTHRTPAFYPLFHLW